MVGRPSEAKARFKEGTIAASSVTFAVVGEVVFNRLRKSGLWLLGRRYDVGVFEEIRLDAQCGGCSGRVHIEAHGSGDVEVEVQTPAQDGVSEMEE